MRRSTAGLLLIVTTMVAALAVLAFMQYRWLGELSEAEQQRMRAALSFSTHEVAQEADHEVSRIPANFQNAAADPDELARRAVEWRSNARDARLVRAFYLAQPDDANGGKLGLERLDVAGGKLVPMPWPPELAAVQALVSAPESGEQRRPPPVVTSIPALLMAVRPMAPPDPAPPPRPSARSSPDGHWFPGPGGPLDRRAPPPDGRRFGPPGLDGSPPRRPPPGQQDQLASRDGASAVEPQPAPQPRQRRPPRPAILIAQLDRTYLVSVLVPDLARRFLGADYDLAVFSGREVLSRSDRVWPRDTTDHGEADAPFLALRTRADGGDAPWRLVVRQHSGAVADLVERARQRNLAIGAAVLLLLVGSIVVLVVLTRRAERMRLQQMEFVAAITHELNTPIAAVTSAGQNLADGIVREPGQVTRYGALIAKEARRLSDTVTQLLDFAGLQRRDRAPQREPVDVAAMIGDAIAQCRWMAEEHGVVLEERVPRDLPLVEGDPLALARAVQNLVANAIRHGAEGRWAGVKASAEAGRVIIRVEDRGPGIAPRDARRIFEPFFRGRHSSRVRGSGLGLAIVRRVALAHGGSIRVERRSRGTAFVLTLRAASSTSSAAEVQHA
jgi:signal transduction histidine kinase